MGDYGAPALASPVLRPAPVHVAALDGLRGLALLGVLSFHAGGALPGGYLGVDLFFVLSGYLITSLLLREHAQAGSIDLYGFWVRRCRRLFPALLSLVPAIAVYSRLFAPTQDLGALRAEALATLGYFANWQAIVAHRSYWQLFKAASPLEHTWSLSIEEQFYVVWPLLAVVLLKRGGARALRVFALVLMVASMAAMALLFSAADSSRAYLGTDTRMAAILAGAALATVLAPGAELSARLVRRLDWLGGIAGVGLCVAWATLRGNDPFLYRGGFWLTELADLLLIACAISAQRSVVARALAARPLRLLGTISYGVYLWHWPVNVFVTTERFHIHALALQALRLAITFLIAGISYRYLEQPIRQRGLRFLRPQFTLPITVTLVVLLIVQSTDARAGVEDTPGVYDAAPSGNAPPFRIVLLGDSTANSMGWGLRGLHAAGVQVAQLGKDGCSLLEGGCNSQRWVERVRELRPDATLVYVAGAFLHGFSADDGWHAACYADWDQKLEHELTQRLSDLQHAPSRVFAATLPYPLGSWDKPEYRSQIDCINAVVRKACAAAPAVTILDVGEQLCPGGVCNPKLASGPVVRPDGVHFSIEGAHDIASWVLTQMRGEGSAPAR